MQRPFYFLFLSTRIFATVTLCLLLGPASNFAAGSVLQNSAGLRVKRRAAGLPGTVQGCHATR